MLGVIYNIFINRHKTRKYTCLIWSPVFNKDLVASLALSLVITSQESMTRETFSNHATCYECSANISPLCLPPYGESQTAPIEKYKKLLK